MPQLNCIVGFVYLIPLSFSAWYNQDTDKDRVQMTQNSCLSIKHTDMTTKGFSNGKLIK